MSQQAHDELNAARAAAAERFSIELDCPPGNPRPGDLIAGVLAGTGLIPEDFDPPSRFFGCWTWVLRSGDEHRVARFKHAQPTLKERVTALHEAGVIRYGSW